MSDIIIKSRCSIDSSAAVVNGKRMPFSGDFSSGIRELYRSNEINYPKFYKMDDLSKLAFIAAELALKDAGMLQENYTVKTGVILMTSNSSLDTDCTISQSITDSDN